ncbi:MAG: alpha/beta hydrolase [Myxococcota bacterium]|nr:alpha/beta hydrolase [Myxococcota bacterium]
MLLGLFSARSDAATPHVVEPLLCDPIQGYLSASLYLPPEPTAVVIVDVGAKMWDRWGDTPSHAYGHYRSLAEGLAGSSVAVVLYDKRGTGASPGVLDDMPGRIRDSESMTACASTRLPGVPQVRLGHSMGTRVVSQAPSGRAGTVLLSPVISNEQYPAGPVLVLRGELDETVKDGKVVPGADHLLMRDGALASEVVPLVEEWIRSTVAAMP